MKKKLLHIALGNHNTGLWKAFDKHFNTFHYNWWADSNDIEKLNKKIIELHNSFNPDVVFMQIQKEGIIYTETAKEITKSSFTINWTGDVRYPLPNWFIELGKHISITLFSNMKDVELSRKQGINSDFLQVGFDPEIFKPYGGFKKTPDIIFLGSNYISSNQFPLSQLRIDLVNKLYHTFGSDFMAYGGNWEENLPNSVFLDENEEAIAYRSCKIAINLSHFNYERYSSDRLLRLIGSGAFCLSQNYDGIENDFQIKRYLDTWNNLDELVNKINYYWQNDYKRELIAKQGCKFVRDNFTWDKRMIELKKYIL
jgi:spore maturation protein CgeB